MAKKGFSAIMRLETYNYKKNAVKTTVIPPHVSTKTPKKHHKNKVIPPPVYRVKPHQKLHPKLHPNQPFYPVSFFIHKKNYTQTLHPNLHPNAKTA